MDAQKVADKVISIHAPRTGSDQGNRRRGRRLIYFNPRSPHGERRIVLHRILSA